jgi:hypothetical protein
MSDEVKLGGGTLSQRVQKGDKLRPPERSEREHADRLMSGEAWRGFCRSLERSGDFLLTTEGPQDERTRAEGFKYLLGVSEFGMRIANGLGNPEYPTFVRNEDAYVKSGAENADNHYLQTNIRGDRSYRIRGDRGSCLGFLIEVKEGFMHLGDVRNFATLTADELVLEDDGSFEILASSERPAGYRGNWLPLDPDATQIVIRTYLYDWAAEDPARFTIECLATVGKSPEPLGAARMGRMLDEAGHLVEMTTKFWAEWMPQMHAEHVRGELKPARPFVGGADDIRYGNDTYELAPEEAIVIETDVPDARYWHYQLCNPWFVTMDYANRTNSINGAQAHLDRDGRFRVVIAHRDPGCPNWLDTGGEGYGMIQYRYVWTKDSPEPSLRVVPFDDVWQHLPEGTPRVSAEQRAEQIAVRQRAVARRTRL